MYVDSGSSSMIISAVVAGGAGALVAAKVGWNKMTGGLRRNKAVDTTGTPDSEQK